MTATVIIPITGDKLSHDAIESVLAQTYPTTCYVVVDGQENWGPANDVLTRVSYSLLNKMKVCYLPINVGANGFYGHRVYAAFSHLVNTDFVCYLDQDNWLEPNHVESCVRTIMDNDLDWCHSLRNIWTKERQFVCPDNCESLGKHRPYVNYDHIDTNTYFLKAEVAHKMAAAWHGGWGQDRVFYQFITQCFIKWGCSGEYTVNYRVDGQQGSVTKEFFMNGNKAVDEIYHGEYPWTKKR